MRIYQMRIWTDNKMKILYLFFVIVILGFQSCGERTIIRHYYIIESPEINNLTEQDTTHGEGICEVLRVRIPPAYDQQRIAVRQRSNEINYYQHNYWAMNPSENLTSLLEQQVKISRLFAFLSSEYLKGIPDYQIASDVYRIEVLDKDDVYSIQLEMRLELIDYRSEKVVVIHNFNRTKALESRDLNLFASGLGIIFQEEMAKFITKMKSYLEINHI